MWDGHTNQQMLTVAFNVEGETLIARAEGRRHNVTTVFDGGLNKAAGVG